MIRVTVEIWPNGNRTRKKEIAHMNIGNISDLSAISSYKVEVSSVSNPLAKNPVAFSARGIVEGHRRADSVWSLLEKTAAWAADLAKRS
jgi:hypothetical protein